MDDNTRHPNQAEEPKRPVQLGVGACLAWPLRCFAFRERLALERVIEVDVLLEDDVDGPGDLLLDQSTSNGRVLLTCLPLVELLDLWEVLNRSNRRVAQGELQMSVPVLPTPVATLGA